MELLHTLPRERWTDLDGQGRSLLHYACWGDNVAALVALVAHGLDPNALDNAGVSPVLFAGYYAPSRVLEILCAVGAVVQPLDEEGPLDAVLASRRGSTERVCVLLANGVRLRNALGSHAFLINREMRSFERGVLRCRAAVVAMLRVKRASGKLVRWDKYLLIELAISVWATRWAKAWQD